MKETQYIEFKPNFNEDVIETLVAFANTKGGRVLVGVNNNGLPVNNFTIGMKVSNSGSTKSKPKLNHPSFRMPK
jgi:ATP-dependent DNA helicase RecG